MARRQAREANSRFYSVLDPTCWPIVCSLCRYCHTCREAPSLCLQPFIQHHGCNSYGCEYRADRRLGIAVHRCCILVGTIITSIITIVAATIITTLLFTMYYSYAYYYESQYSVVRHLVREWSAVILPYPQEWKVIMEGAWSWTLGEELLT